MIGEHASRAFWKLANSLQQMTDRHQPQDSERVRTWISQQWALANQDDPISAGTEPTFEHDFLHTDFTH